MAVVFGVGAPIFINQVEDDLERRAVDVLNAAEIGPVTARFSGQDGELRCPDGPVDIPADVLDEIRDEWGVTSLDVDATCTASVRPGGDDSENAEDAGDAAETPETTAATTTTTEVVAATTSTVADTEPDLDVIADVVANDTQFSTLTGLLADADLVDVLGSDGPFTVFAPTNAAFEELGADVIGELTRNPETLSAVLLHHVTNGAVGSADLADGDIEMLDGTAVTVEIDDSGVLLASGTSESIVTEPDLVAANGIVHAIDQVLVPDGMVFGEAAREVVASARFLDGQITLTGRVVTAAQRDLLVAAAEAQVDAANVIDELVVDDSILIVSGNVDALGAVIGAMPPNLISGTADLSANTISVNGIYASDADRAAAEAAFASIGGPDVLAELTERASASGEDAAALEADLNALVAENPILFDPNSADISAASAATIDRVAATAARFSDVAIEVQGHTDTDGEPATNQALSEGRAAAVVAALVERGLDGSTLTDAGFGGTQPILDADGVEDKAASRRVEFVVVATQ